MTPPREMKRFFIISIRVEGLQWQRRTIMMNGVAKAKTMLPFRDYQPPNQLELHIAKKVTYNCMYTQENKL